MTSEQIALVQHSWRHVEPMSDLTAELFYERLFDLEPAVRPLFKSDMKAQGRKLMAMMSFAVGSLSRLEALTPALQVLGRRHAAYGVEERHYAVVGSALLWTLSQGLGKRFTREVEDAWRADYEALAAAMKQSATQATTQAAA